MPRTSSPPAAQSTLRSERPRDPPAAARADRPPFQRLILSILTSPCIPAPSGRPAGLRRSGGAGRETHSASSQRRSDPPSARRPAHARRPPGAGCPCASAPSRTCRRFARIAGPSVSGRCPVRRSPGPAAGAGGRPGARCRDPPGRSDGGFRRFRRRGRLGLEGRLRGRRGRLRAVPATLRPGHAPHLRRRGGRAAPHAGDAGGHRRAGALAHQALGGAGPAPAVLDPAAARLCGVAGRRDPAGRRRAGALGRHRRAGGHGGMRAGQLRHGQSPSQRIRADAGAASDPAVPAGGGYRLQRRVHRRPAARRPADRGADEPAVFGDAGGGSQPARRRPPPCPLGRLDAAAGRPAGDHHLGPLRPGRRRRPSRSPGALRLHHGHRRPRLRPARHRLRHPPHRAGARRRPRCRAGRDRPRRQRRRAARCRHRAGAEAAADRACTGPGRPRPRPVRQAGRAEACNAPGPQARIHARDSPVP